MYHHKMRFVPLIKAHGMLFWLAIWTVIHSHQPCGFFYTANAFVVPMTLHRQRQQPPTTMVLRGVAEASNLETALPTTTHHHCRREELKRQILQLADHYQQEQRKLDQQRIEASDAARQKMQQTEQMTHNADIRKLLSRIVQKVLRRQPQHNNENRILRKESLGTRQVNTGVTGQAIIQLAEELATLNPTPVPLYGWKGYHGGDPTMDCKLDGLWKLRFTTAADATFSTSPLRGQIQTFQDINATAGTLTNVVTFEKGKLRGFRVVVAGQATSDTALDLTFSRVILLRKSRFPRWLGKVVIPIPARLLRWINRTFMSSDNKPTQRRGPYLQIKYLDDNFRMHTTGQGNWFIQTRLESNEVENSMMRNGI